MSEGLSAEAVRSIQQDYFLQFILDPKTILEDLYHRLKGETLIEESTQIEGRTVMVPVYKNLWNLKPLIDNEGINLIMYILNGTLTPGNATGNIDTEKVAMLTQDLYQKIYCVLYTAMQHHQYGIENEGQLKLITVLIRNAIYLHFSKSAEGTFLRQMSTSYSYAEIKDGKTGKEAKQTNMTV